MAPASVAGGCSALGRWSARALIVATAAAGVRLHGQQDGGAAGKGRPELLPFDCYIDKGADYQGLLHMTTSGRTCKNWLQQDTFAPSTRGIGNHNYCRNPSGSKDKPWCHTVDPEVDWEYCDVPECPAGGAPPEPWTAPPGAKSPEAEAKGPCKYEPPAKPLFTEYEAGRACMDHRGSTWWLIGNKNTTVADAPACGAKCLELPGTEYFTFWEAATEGNCGCYRQCILVPLELTVKSPTVFRVA